MKARLTKTHGTWAKEDWIFSQSYKKSQDEPKCSINTGLITYMAKGNLSPMYVRGISETDIQRFTALWVEYKPKVIKKPTYDVLVKEAMSIAPFGTVPKIEVFNNLITVLNKHKIVCGRYKVRDMFDTMLRINNPMGFTNDMSEMCNFPQKRMFD
jgi:hypothetical protein